jgi:protein-disulfide isomerase
VVIILLTVLTEICGKWNIVSKNREQLEAARLRAQKQQQQQLISIAVVVGTAIVAFVLMLVFINSTSRTQVSTGKYDMLAQTVTADGLPIIGDPATKFQIIEFSDFGCPFCLQYKPQLDQIIDKQVRTGNVRFIFAPQLFHQNSNFATRGALCAMDQGKFWEMHDELFYIQSTEGLGGFEPGNMKKAADKLKLDSNKWLNCVASDQTDSVPKKSYALFTRVGAQGTPTLMWSSDAGITWNFFVNPNNGQPIQSGGVPVEIINNTIATYYQRNS